MSPRFPSAITCSPADRAYAQTSSSARRPSAPSASKNATCGFTPTTYGATASTSPRQKRAHASAACARPRCASPFSSTGSRSGRGSSPTTSCERLRSTASARRSAKCVVVTVAIALSVLPSKDSEGPAGPSRNYWRRGSSLRLAGLDGLLELAPGCELRHRGCRDRHLLSRIAGIHALPLGAPLGCELPEAGERHFSAALQCVGDRVEEGVNGPRRISARKAGLGGDLVYKLLFRQVPLLLSTGRT